MEIEAQVERAFTMIRDLYGEDVISDLQFEDCGDGTYHFDFVTMDKDNTYEEDIRTICNDNNLSVEAYDAMDIDEESEYPVADITMTVVPMEDQFAESKKEMNGFGEDGLPKEELERWARKYTKQFIHACREHWVWDDDDDLEDDIIYTIRHDHPNFDEASVEWITSMVELALYDEGLVEFEGSNFANGHPKFHEEKEEKPAKRMKEGRDLILEEADPENPLQTMHYPYLMKDIVETDFPYGDGSYFIIECDVARGCLQVKTDDPGIATVLQDKYGFVSK